MNQKHLYFTVLFAVSLTVSACGPSAEQIATMTAAAWTATPPPTATPLPTATPPYSAEVRAEADQAFASGAMVYLYDPQPATVSKSNLDSTKFSLRYILSKDARDVTNILLLWKVNAQGTKEFIIPETNDLLVQTVNLRDWISSMGTITFTTSSRMADTSDQQGVDPNVAVFTTWIITWDSVTPLYGHPNQHVEDPVYIDVLLLSPEERDGALLLSDASKQLSNIVRIPVSP